MVYHKRFAFDRDRQGDDFVAPDPDNVAETSPESGTPTEREPEMTGSRIPDEQVKQLSAPNFRPILT